MNFGMDFIRKLKPCNWRWKGSLDDGRKHFGVIAQELDEVAPNGEYGFIDINDGVYMVNYHEMIGPIVRAIQELDKRISKLE